MDENRVREIVREELAAQASKKLTLNIDKNKIGEIIGKSVLSSFGEVGKSGAE